MLRIASDLGRAIGKGKINPVDLAEYFLDAIARHPLADRIDARTTQARARGEALAAASWAKSGMRKGLLDGVPLCETFDTVGRLAHCVEDCAQLLAALSGNKPADLTGCSLKGLRLMVLNTVTMDNLRDAPAKGFDDALQRLGRAGAQIEPQSAPEVTEAMALAGFLFTAKAYAIWGETIEAAPEKMYPRVLDRFRSGKAVSASAYIAG